MRAALETCSISATAASFRLKAEATRKFRAPPDSFRPQRDGRADPERPADRESGGADDHEEQGDRDNRQADEVDRRDVTYERAHDAGQEERRDDSGGRTRRGQ